MEAKEWLKWICSSQDLDELGKNYDQWSDQYEADISQVWEAVPKAAALMLSQYLDDQQSLILDFGAGTGLVGVALAALGFEQIVGMDISPKMLTLAQEKGVYSSLMCGSIDDEQLRNLDQVSGIIATGVFAENHAGVAELSKLQAMIKPEGILVFTVRQSFLAELEEVLNQPEWTLLDSQVMPIYDDPMHLLGYKISKPLN